MNLSVEELKHIQSLVLEQITSAASKGNVARVAELSNLAWRVEEAKKNSPDSLPESEKSIRVQKMMDYDPVAEGAEFDLPPTDDDLDRTTDLSKSKPTDSHNKKKVSAQERNKWVEKLRERGIFLHGHGTQYQTASGRSVAVHFANELLNKKTGQPKNRWFLGLRDECPDVAVLLCKPLSRVLHDIVLPVSFLRKVWDDLTRSNSNDEVLFNVKEDGSRLLLVVTHRGTQDVTTYASNYEPLL